MTLKRIPKSTIHGCDVSDDVAIQESDGGDDDNGGLTKPKSERRLFLKTHTRVRIVQRTRRTLGGG
jgi:hypothetical protein